jgi:acyl-ACP thioesterase
MPDTIPIWVEKFKIRSYEVDAHGKASIQSICNYLQEAAGNHAFKLGVSVDLLFKKKLTWVLSRMRVIMDAYPMWRRSLKIETWPSGLENLYAIRDFELYDHDGQKIGKATNSYMLLNLETKKPVSMPDFIREIRFPKSRAIDDKFEKLPKPEKKDLEKQFKVRLSDLDINQHVNNVNFIEWAVETIPQEVWKNYMLKDLEINFRAEGKYGDRVISCSQKIEDTNKIVFLHDLSREKDQKQVALARTVWHKFN